MNSYQDKIARILRTDKHIIGNLEADLQKATGKIGVLEKILEENDKLLSDRLSLLGVRRNSSATEIFDALISKIESDDVQILKYLGIISSHGSESAKTVVNFIKTIYKPPTGYFLKKEKARQLLIAEPPKNILAAMGYKYVEEMLQKEDLLEIYSALRFLEDPEWQNKVFFKQYETLHPDDFEEREIEIRALNPRWAKAAEKFVEKKYHNVSHLKELGVIFVIPLFLGISGETLRLISLLLHYLYEVQFYSVLFKKLSTEKNHFAAKLISLLRGDVIEMRLPTLPVEARRPRFLVIQRYLAKDDENDWRLAEPHINPEALHWQRAEAKIVSLGNTIPNFQNGLEFWKDLGAIGDFFTTETGVPVLVSFNIVDTVMALVQRKELIKYLYHHQEAMWNKIFESYFGSDKLEEYSKEYILKGWFEV